MFSAFAKVDEVTPAREARGFIDCYTRCTDSFGGPINTNPVAGPICAAKCAFARKLEDTPLKSLSENFIISSAQPIDQGQFL
jgi:hypothetical protein